MKNVNNAIIQIPSRSHLKKMVKIHGLQAWMFDENLLYFEWKGLEYEFYVYDQTIVLTRINVLRNVPLTELDKVKSKIKKNTPKLPDFLQ